MRYPGSEFYSPVLMEKVRTIFFIDIETTGLDIWRNEILTMSLSAVDHRTLERRESIELTFRPVRLHYWQKEAEDIHRISVAKAIHFEDKKDSSEMALAFMEKHSRGAPQVLACHAFDIYKSLRLFDVSMLMAHFEELGMRQRLYQCVAFFESTETYFREARRLGYYRAGGDLFNQDQEGKDFKLKTLCRHYKIHLNHHNAQSDREACEALYRIARSIGTNEEESAFDIQVQSNGRNHSGEEGGHPQLHPDHQGDRRPNEASGAGQELFI